MIRRLGEEAAVDPSTRETELQRQVDELRARLRRATGAEAIDDQISQASRLETVGQLAGGIAHDFNNILGVIINYAQFVIDELDKDSPTRADVEEISRAAQRGAALTRQLTIFSRHERHAVEPLDLSRVVSGIEVLLGHTLGEHAELATSLEPEPWPILADRGQLEQALVNLALNARDAMPDGGTLTIRTANVELDDHAAMAYPDIEAGRFVRLTVEDDGRGMDGEVLVRAFEPFYTTKPQGEGTGLGLAIVYRIVTGAGGALSLDSEPEVGTWVTAHFPAADIEVRPTARAAAGHPAASGETVLVVEDEPSMRRMAARILSDGGYDVVCTPGAHEALRKLEQAEGKVDLLLSDVIMPEMSGTELAARVSVLYPDLRILLMSGFTDRPEVAPVNEGVPLLEKPFRAEGLLARVRAALDADPPAKRQATVRNRYTAL